jgi:hypothetical protein
MGQSAIERKESIKLNGGWGVGSPGKAGDSAAIWGVVVITV